MADPTPDPMDIFVQMSVLLTGFADTVIAPSLDPVELKTTYFDTAKAQLGDTFDSLLATYCALVAEFGDDTQAIADRLLGLDGHSQDPQIVAAAQAINSQWYLGSWYPPGGGNSFVVSDQAYIGGLAWKAMQSHAMGYSTFTFGYWADDPPPLADFTGNSAPPSDGDSQS